MTVIPSQYRIVEYSLAEPDNVEFFYNINKPITEVEFDNFSADHLNFTNVDRIDVDNVKRSKDFIKLARVWKGAAIAAKNAFDLLDATYVYCEKDKDPVYLWDEEDDRGPRKYFATIFDLDSDEVTFLQQTNKQIASEKHIEWHASACLEDHDFKNTCIKILQISKFWDGIIYAGSNAMMILNCLDHHFQDTDLQGVRIKNARLPWVVLDDADLSDADLSNIDFSTASLSRTQLANANLKDAFFGKFPNLEHDHYVLSAVEVPGKNQLISTDSKSIYLWDLDHLNNNGKPLFKSEASENVNFNIDGNAISPPTFLEISYDEQFLYRVYGNGQIELWNFDHSLTPICSYRIPGVTHFLMLKRINNTLLLIGASYGKSLFFDLEFPDPELINQKVKIEGDRLIRKRDTSLELKNIESVSLSPDKLKIVLLFKLLEQEEVKDEDEVKGFRTIKESHQIQVYRLFDLMLLNSIPFNPAKEKVRSPVFFDKDYLLYSVGQKIYKYKLSTQEKELYYTENDTDLIHSSSSYIDCINPSSNEKKISYLFLTPFIGEVDNSNLPTILFKQTYITRSLPKRGSSENISLLLQRLEHLTLQPIVSQVWTNNTEQFRFFENKIIYSRFGINNNSQRDFIEHSISAVHISKPVDEGEREISIVTRSGEIFSHLLEEGKLTSHHSMAHKKGETSFFAHRPEDGFKNRTHRIYQLPPSLDFFMIGGCVSRTNSYCLTLFQLKGNRSVPVDEKSKIASFALSQDGKHVITAHTTETNEIKLWKVLQNAELQVKNVGIKKLSSPLFKNYITLNLSPCAFPISFVVAQNQSSMKVFKIDWNSPEEPKVIKYFPFESEAKITLSDLFLLEAGPMILKVSRVSDGVGKHSEKSFLFKRNIKYFDVSENGDRIVTLSSRNPEDRNYCYVSVYNLQDQNEIACAQLPILDDCRMGIKISHDGNVIAAWSTFELRIWKIMNATLRLMWKMPRSLDIKEILMSNTIFNSEIGTLLSKRYTETHSKIGFGKEKAPAVERS